MRVLIFCLLLAVCCLCGCDSAKPFFIKNGLDYPVVIESEFGNDRRVSAELKPGETYAYVSPGVEIRRVVIYPGDRRFYLEFNSGEINSMIKSLADPYGYVWVVGDGGIKPVKR